MTSRTGKPLTERVHCALDVAEQVVDSLLDESPRIDLSTLESPPDKVIAETALLLRAFSALPDGVADGVAVRAHLVARRLEPHARSLRVRVNIALHPALARDYAIAHSCLSAMGHHDPDFEVLLGKALAAPQSAGRERLPHRHLEQAWIESLRGGLPADDLASHTALRHGIDPLTGSRDDIYALTHASLYATDIGQRDIALPRSAALLSREADAALSGALDADDFDLAGEVLMLWPMLRLPWSPAAWFGVSLLLAVEDEVGLLPSLAIDAAAMREHHGMARRQLAMATTYHTAYVMGLLCALLLQRRGAPVAPPEAPIKPELLTVAQAALDGLARGARWQSHFDALPAAHQQVLAPFVLDVAIRRAVHRMELGIAYRLVLAAAAADVRTLLVEQAAGFLDRVQLLNELIAPLTGNPGRR